MKAINDDYLSSSITINDMMAIDGASFEAAKDIGMTPWEFGAAPRQSQEKKLQEKKRRSPKHHHQELLSTSNVYNTCK